MAKYDNLPSGKIRQRVTINGKRLSFTGKTQKEVRQKVADYIYFSDNETSDREDPRVKYILKTYIASKEGVLSPATIRGYRAIVKHFEPLYDVRLSELTAPDIQYLISGYAKDHSAKSTKNLWALLSSALGQFSDKRYKITLPTYIRPKQYTPTDNEVKAFLTDCPEILKIAAALSAFGTLRRGELSALKYEDLDRDNNTITVHSDMVFTTDNEWICKPYPKTTASIRNIIYPSEVINMIPEGQKSDYIIPLNPAALYNQFRRRAEKLGLKGFTIQSLRRYAASSMHSQGIPDKYIQGVGGWSSDQVLKLCYENRLTDQEKAFNNKRVEYVSRKFFGHEVDTKPAKP